jgi:Uma2 family endonuclease
MTNSPTESDRPIVGQRRVFYFNDNGQPAYQSYDLTSDDYIDPQVSDEFFHGEVHERAVRILASQVHHHYRYSPTVSVHIKPKIIWTDAALSQPMPDLVLVNHLSDPQRHRPILDLNTEQAAEQAMAQDAGKVSVRAIFEVTSPLLASYDLETKRGLYARAGVPEYWIIDTGLRPDQDQIHYTVLGFQLQDGSYTPIPAQSNGRWESPACRLWITVSPDHQSFQLGDLRTGKPFPIPADDDDPSIAAQAEAARRAQSIADQLKITPE